MQADCSAFFRQYEALVQEVEKTVQPLRKEYATQITCYEGCADCCHAMFDLHLVEAMYLHHKFNEAFTGQKRSDILDRADRADREAYKKKREIFKLSSQGAQTKEILEMAAKSRVRCPLLNSEDRCELYEARPLTCRLYGLPTAISGQAHTCNLSGFQPGTTYKTVHIEKIQDRLALISAELVASLRTRYTRLHETFVPVSMALMNKYDAEYLGLLSEEEWEKIQQVQEALNAQPAPAKEQPFHTENQLQDGVCNTCPEQKGSSACSSCSPLTWELGTEKKGGSHG